MNQLSRCASALLIATAGLLAGAFSMAAGEYISMQSQREVFERQIAVEREEMRVMPDVEQKELEQIYRAKGLPAADAAKVAAHLMEDPKIALDTKIREERHRPFSGKCAQDVTHDAGRSSPEVTLGHCPIGHIAARPAAHENLGPEVPGTIEASDAHIRSAPRGEDGRGQPRRTASDDDEVVNHGAARANGLN